jgi:hypothetical protein
MILFKIKGKYTTWERQTETLTNIFDINKITNQLEF